MEGKESLLKLDCCLLCQTEKQENLRSPQTEGKTSFLRALKERYNAGDTTIYNHIVDILQVDSQSLFELKNDIDIVWHKSCFSTFTSSTNIARIYPKASGDLPPTRIKRRFSFDWKHLCMFCGQKSFNKDRKLINVSTFEFCKTLEQRVIEKKDHDLMCQVGDFSKLMSLEAHYHKACHSRYIVCEKKKSSTDNYHQLAYQQMMETLLPELSKGMAFDMNEVLERYKTFLLKHLPEDSISSFTKHKLKAKIQAHHGDSIVFIQTSTTRPELLISHTVQVQDIINKFASSDESSLENLRESQHKSDKDMFNPDRTLLHAANYLRMLVRNCDGIAHQPLNPCDISERNCENMIPQELYNFFFWSLTGSPVDQVNMDEVKGKDPVLHRHILSVCQDVIYMASNGKCRTPKHVGLGVSLHQLTQSQEVVKLVNRHGHSISYDEVQRIDAKWAEVMLDQEVTVPSNMVVGKVTRGAGDNFNRATESVMNMKHHDVVNMVLFQTASSESGTFGNFVNQRKKTRPRTVQDATVENLLQCPPMTGKRPGPQHLLGQVKISWFTECLIEHQNMRAIDDALFLVKGFPSKMFNVEFTPLKNSKKPSWTVYHAAMTSNTNIQQTNIGYCPMIPASAVDFNTVYTMMKEFQRMFRALGQEWTMVTYDEAIYSKAQMIKWKSPKDFENDELEMGGFHRAMNFIGDIGHIMQDSGFEDVLVESNLYGPAVVNQVMKGKAYNRGVRVHKIMNEAFNRLRWSACWDWLRTSDHTLSEEDSNTIQNSIEQCITAMNDTEYDNAETTKALSECVQDLIQSTGPLMEVRKTFIETGKRCSDTFTFWNNYIDMSQLLLDYIAAKRDDNRSLELETFAEMLPYDFMCGHLNYARWGSVNVAEGHLLKEKKPDIYEALSSGNWSLHHTNRPFSGIWHDMGIEQSLNKDCGKFHQLYTTETALNKYYLTAHLKAEVRAAMKQLSGFQQHDTNLHKESTNSRMAKDECDIQKIVSTVSDRMFNPFVIESGSSSDNKQPLINIASSSVVPEDISNRLCHVKSEGVSEMKHFISSRLNSDEVDFFAPMKRSGMKTFSSLNKHSMSQDKKNSQQLNIDRQVFSRLAVLAQSRDINMRNVLQYELAPVPLSLFNIDGTMRKTAKNMTLSWMERDFAVDSIPFSDEKSILVVDFMMVLRMICTDTSSCNTFGELSDAILSVVLNHGFKFTAVVGDDYSSQQSIKACERSRRGQILMHDIYNPSRNTPLPKQRSKMLSNPRNKSSTADFIMNDWMQQCQNTLPENKVVYLAGGFADSRQAVEVRRGGIRNVPELESDHEEADSRMFLHVSHAITHLNVKEVVLWSIDSDVAAICPRSCVILGIKSFFFKTGVGQRKCFIPMHKVADTLGRDMSLILPAIHALSGCDSTSAFSGIGKRKWMKCIARTPELVRGLMEVGEDAASVTDEAIKSCVSLAHVVYSQKKGKDLDTLRYELFCTKKINSERLPPTMDAFMQHLKRVNYQTFIWTHPEDATLNLPNPLQCGWTANSTGQLVPLMMTRSPAPEALLIFTDCGCKGICDTRRCKCRKEQITCSDMCACSTVECTNRVAEDSDDEME